MTYRDRVKPLAEGSKLRVEQLVAALRTGQISAEEFAELAAITVATYNRRAAGEADIALAVALVRAGKPVSPLGLVPDDEERLLLSFGTILNGVAAQLRARAGVLARAEPLAAAQDTYAEGMRRHGVGSWTRETDANPCKVCRDLTGAILPSTVTMYHHPGCSCTQRVILDPS